MSRASVTRSVALGALLSVAACADPSTGILLTIESDGTLDEVLIDSDIGMATSRTSPTGGTLETIETISILVSSTLDGEPVEISVQGQISGSPAGRASGSVAIQAGSLVPLTLSLTRPCGNGTLEAGESCDDENQTGGDGCSATCTVEPGFSCTGVPSVCVSGCDPACSEGQRCDPDRVCRCDPATCAGCCDGDACVAGDTAGSCGTMGENCQACVSGDMCRAGECSSCSLDSCGGCCAGASCVDALEFPNCGVSAAGDCVSCDVATADGCAAGACSCGGGPSCGASETCVDGACRVECTPDTCDGCCNGEICVAEPSLTQCGVAGEACQACRPGRADACIFGVCQCGTDFECPDGSACTDGRCVCIGAACMLGGACVPNDQPSSCGDAGGTCTVCDAQADRCTDGVCTCGTGPACGPEEECMGGACRCDGVICGAGLRCIGRFCECDTISCDGCCRASECQPGTTRMACGVGGVACMGCGAGVCMDGSCL